MAKLVPFNTRRRLPAGGLAGLSTRASKSVKVTNPKAGPIAVAKRTPSLGMGGYQRNSA